MAAQHAPREVHDLPFAVLHADELVPVAGVEVLRIGFVRHVESVRTRVGAHLLFGETTEGKERVRELFLREAVEEIALVLAFVRRALYGETPVAAHDARVVSGGEGLEVESALPRETRQEAELHARVAEHAGVGGASGKGGLAEVVQHVALVGVRAVEHAVFDAEAFREGCGLCDVEFLARAEAGVARAALVASLAPELHRDAHHLVAGVLQHERRDGRVDAAGESDGDLHFGVPAEVCGWGAGLFRSSRNTTRGAWAAASSGVNCPKAMTMSRSPIFP